MSNREPTEQAAGRAREEGKNVAHTASEEAKGVAHDARQQGQAVAQRARAEAGQVAEDVKDQLRTQAQDQTTKASASLRRLGDQIAALAQGRPQESGKLSDYAEQAADEVRNFAGRLDSRGFDGVVQDTEDFARRRPGAFLLTAAAAGFTVSRMFRAGREARQGSSEEHADQSTSMQSAGAAEGTGAQTAHRPPGPLQTGTPSPPTGTPDPYRGMPSYEEGTRR